MPFYIGYRRVPKSEYKRQFLVERLKRIHLQMQKTLKEIKELEDELSRLNNRKD